MRFIVTGEVIEYIIIIWLRVVGLVQTVKYAALSLLIYFYLLSNLSKRQGGTKRRNLYKGASLTYIQNLQIQ